jgi:prephenate dehydratase
MPITQLASSSATRTGERQGEYMVAFQGELGAYSEEAIVMHWGMQAKPVALRTFDDVTDAVVQGFTQYGIFPIENTIVGPITLARNALERGKGMGADIEIIDEITLPIRHALLAPPEATLSTLTHVESHPVALTQCRRFFETHSHLSAIESYDTAGAAKEVAAARDLSRGAIAGTRAAIIYNLQILAEDIQDMPNNQTRFVVIANKNTINTRGDRW